MLGAKKHARCFPKVSGNARRNARRSMFGAKMLGAHVRRRGFPLKKEQSERYHTTTIYSLHEKSTFLQVSSI